MKKLLFLIAAVWMISITAEAQKGKEVILGVNGALTNVWVINQNFYGEPQIDYAPKMGYTAGINLGYDINGNAGIMAEVHYSLQGQKYDGKQNGIKTERNIDLRYMNIPLFFKYAFGQDQTRFRVMIGPQMGILMDASQEYLWNDQVKQTKVNDLNGVPFQTGAKNIKDRFEKIDFGIAIDIGTDINLSKVFFVTAGIRGNYGFKDINAEPYRLENLDGEYNPSHNLWGGLYFGINYRIDVEGYTQRSF
ncbi:MAG: porin family protein [Bacteroidales bacterium]